VRVAIVAEYYPRAADPVLGVWAHQQALATRSAGTDVRVLVLHRLVPPRDALRRGRWQKALEPLRQPRRLELDGIDVRYVPFVSPPRPRNYGSWGAWAAPPLALALRALRRSFPFELVHAHYAAPAGDAVRRTRLGVPLVVSAHGGDVFAVARQSPAGRRAVESAFAAARLVLANSRAVEARCRSLGATATTVVNLGSDLPKLSPCGPSGAPRIVTVAHLVARKRHVDVLRALWLLRESEPRLRWVVVGDGPERPSLERLAAELGVAGRVEFRGAVPHTDALEVARSADVFVLPSVEEAFGVAYVEAMAGAVPAIGCRGESGPEEIGRRGRGIVLVPPNDPQALATELRALLVDDDRRLRLGESARRTVAEHFTWKQCGRATVAAYEEALKP